MTSLWAGRLNAAGSDPVTSVASATHGQGLVMRLIDIVVAATALLVLGPLLLVIAIAIRLDSPGPALFRQQRIGRFGHPFVMLKLRTMATGCDPLIHQEYVHQLLTDDAESLDGLYKLRDDPRVTRVGELLRRTSLDELPQLLNILRGDMSLVGPRPALPYEVVEFPDWASSRFLVRPGLTGLWQVSGRNRLTMTEGLQLDVEYVARRTLLVDLGILLRTLPAVLAGGAR